MLELRRHSVLYLLSLAAYGASQSSHDTTISESSRTRSGEATITSAPSAVTSSTTLQGNATCHSRTANYITHTLPQQCLRTNRSVATASSDQNNTSTAEETSSISTGVTNATVAGPPIQRPQNETASTTESLTTSVSQQSSTSTTTTASTTSESSLPSLDAAETETDSPLDNANFLSFEDWKKQNLAKAGQSPENLAGRAQPIDADRRRPGINNALDTFGEENEIELDFSGFGSNFDHTGNQQPSGTPENSAAVQSSPAQQAHRSKDAGKTCKERTNYASFDCAATILKNNPECKSGSSVLVENKDSYMLNKCSATNKFIIVELCNDILIDTIVLANYEFFSSIFRHFRISVSDRYPVKMEKWKDLGTFEARNTREVQAFLIENPLIWARYLRIEFLTHYGNEYFCPVSLLRVHGTTMMDEFRHQEEIARGEPQDDEVVLEPGDAVEVVVQEPVNASPEVEKDTAQAIPTVEVEVPGSPAAATTVGASEAGPHSSATATSVESREATSSNLPAEYEYFANSTCARATSSLLGTSTSILDGANASDVHSSGSSSQITSLPIEATASDDQNRQSDTKSGTSPSSPTTGSTSSEPASSSAAPPHSDKQSAPHTDSSAASSTSTPSTDQTATPHTEPSTQNPPKPNPSTNTPRPTTNTSPQPPQPSTQESFFKSVSKRLASLESNSTLSLQYIEEQSRILRSAFSAVEKRQITSTNNFLTTVNETVMHELHGFRAAYDQLWQSTVIELEGQRELYQREMLALSTRLTLVADELVWQKRMGIAQSTLLLLCLALVLFNRAAPGGLDVQAMMHKSQAALRAGFESPPNSPSPDGGSRSPVSLFRRKVWRGSEPVSGRGSEEGGSRPVSSGGPRVDVEPPTPSAASGDEGEGEGEDEDAEGEWKEGPEMPEVQSGPATPSGLRDENGPPQWPEDGAQTSSPVHISP